MKKNGILFLILILTFPMFAGISFGNPDLNKNDEVIFTVRQESSGVNAYNSLFYAKIKDGVLESAPQLLTCYPEQMELMSGGNVLQIRNRYGTARYNTKTNQLKWITHAKTIPEKTVLVPAYRVSSDGKWLCYIKKNAASTGNLILENIATGKSIVLNEKVLVSSDDIPVKWAPSGSMFIYEKDDNLFFCNPQALFDGVEIDEKYRKIGRGSINCIEWSSEKYLAYVDDCLVYKINTKELYTLGLYAGIIGQGKVMGRLPFKFDTKNDVFVSNPEVTSLVFIQNGHLYTYLKVQKESCDYMDVIYSRPYTDSQASLMGSYIFWDNSNNPVLWQEKLPYNGSSEQGSVYKLGTEATQVLEIKGSGKPFISPDGTKAAFFSGSIIYIYDINTWVRVAELSGEKVISALWVNRNVLFVGGEKSIRKWNLISNTVETITLSQAESANWNDIESSIIADAGSQDYYRYNRENGTWAKANLSVPLKPSAQNGKYRVFIGKAANQNYENGLYIRTLSGAAVTKPVYSQQTKKTSSPKKIALIFDAYDNADGIPHIISTLKKYNVPGTFFMNGEFIRRYPSETRQIVANGYDCASMFFSLTDLTDNSFIIDEDFIRRGLARNEDEFYQLTGKELLLFWHAPYYKNNELIQKAGANAGYTYIEIDKSISLVLNDAASSDKFISVCYSFIKNSKEGVIPIKTGHIGPETVIPMYKNLDIIIRTILDSGYEIVGVNEL